MHTGRVGRVGRVVVTGLWVAVAAGCGGAEGTQGGRDGGPGLDATPGPTEDDADGDGLPDAWELAAEALELLDPGRADTDGDGTLDGDEDPDGDRLTNLEELALSYAPLTPPGCAPSPRAKDLVVELDSTRDRPLSPALREVVSGAFAALRFDGPAGELGGGLCFLDDEVELPPAELDGAGGARGALLAAHGPKGVDASIPWEKLVHVMMVTRRTDSAERGADTILHGGGVIEESGVLIYVDALRDLHPACGTPELPPITADDALAGSLVHELGHVLQLGHDTEVGEGVNHWNVMSLQSSCQEAQRRVRGVGNDDPALGNTERVGAPRFSAAAAALMRFDRKVSVEVSALDVDGGYEM